MAGTEYIGSHEKPENAYGQNGSAQPSSLMPGQTKSPIKDVSPPQAAVPSLLHADTLGARVHMGDDGKAAAIPAHRAMQPRAPGDGSPGGVNVVPQRSNHSPKR